MLKPSPELRSHLPGSTPSIRDSGDQEHHLVQRLPLANLVAQKIFSFRHAQQIRD